MKTEQAIGKLGQTLWDILGREYIDKYCEDKNGNLVSVSSISVEDIAEELVNAGYGDVSKYKAKIEQLNKKLAKCNDLKKLSDWQREEIEQLKAEVNKGCDNCEAINRAKIDVLKELKTRHDYAIKNMGYPWDISQQIDELINEVENER